MATNMKSLNGYGFDAAALGGKAPEYYIQPRNLLDNSDFRNPVNQRGRVNGDLIDSGYVIDRWRSAGAQFTFTVGENGMELPAGAVLFQRIVLSDKTYTFGIKISNGAIYTFTFNGVTAIRFDESPITFVVTILDDGVMNIHFKPMIGCTVEWVALYEGTYTADTLPPYVPKGYVAELAECRRYFERLGAGFAEQIGNVVFVVSGAKSFVCSLQCSRKRIQHPSVSISSVDNYRLLLKDGTNASTYSAVSISSIDNITTQEPFISFRVNMISAITQNSWIVLQRSDGATAAYIDISADL